MHVFACLYVVATVNVISRPHLQRLDMYRTLLADVSRWRFYSSLICSFVRFIQTVLSKNI